jgi:hypothetical protein
MVKEIRDEPGHIRYIFQTTIDEAGKTYFRTCHATFFAENDFKENDRVRITVERILTNDEH